MNYSLAYGKGTLRLELPERNVVKVLNIQQGVPLAHPIEAVRQKLAAPNGTRALSEIAAGKRSACIVISDITRPVPNQIILPPILETLRRAGVPQENVVILVATGLHRVSTAEEKTEMLGEEIVAQYRVEDHDAHRLDEHRFIGDSTRGVPIGLDRRYLDAEVKILTGLIEPHFMAGYSGGRKSICPGIAAAETICSWHSPRFLEHENARFGCVRENPVHEESLEIALKCGCDFIVNVVIDHHRNVLAVVAGDLEQAHNEGVAFARHYVADYVDEPVDIVVTSSAGYPLDKTWYQSVKGIVGAADILKPGGTVILASACDEGLGSTAFEKIAARFPTIESFMEAILNGTFSIADQWQLEELGKVLRKGKVKVFSEGLPPETFRKYYVESVPSVEQAVAEALQEYGSGASIAVIPDGPYVLAQVRTNERDS